MVMFKTFSFQNDVQSKISLLEQKNKEMTEMLSKLDNKDEVNIDDAVVPTAPIYRQ